MLAAGAVVAFWQTVEAISARRYGLDQITQSACAQGDKQSCQGVHANIRAANAADDMVDIAIWQFVAGLVGIIFVGLTLKATRDAVREANEATEAARSAVRATEDGTRRQLRAYVQVTPAKYWRGGVRVRSPMLFAQGMRIENRGQTPARNALIRRAIRLLPYPLAQELPDVTTGYDQTICVWPGDEIDGGGWAEADRAYADEEIEAALNPLSSVRLYLFGRLTYEDIFGEPRETRFCYFIEPTGYSLTLNETDEVDMLGRKKVIPIESFIWAIYPDGHNSFT